ncbi:hypothetical protein GRI89_04395 [Altererythrobacter salegens]|uniref:Uncharacterized protein n=1 Tax=Croceibacterium salegens TaxID=1737568 RepID=A0A6I4STC7_9SPHN|nr:hypothetical protein [Croceibacterium salegens]MXO58779.1 hypothetical protein [Croceibacterium salegens]
MISLAAVTACTALPDTSGYTLASYQLNSSAAAAGKAVDNEFDRMTGLLPEGRQQQARDAKGRFDVAWGSTTKSMGGLARYAESIEELTDAGNTGKEGAQGVFQSLSTLANAVGILPGGAVVGVVGDTLALANSAIANVRAANSLEKSLTAADPLIADISTVVAKQVDTARAQFDAALTVQEGSLEFSVQDISPTDERLAEQEKNVAARLAALSGDTAREAERKAVAAELERIRAGREALAPRMTAYHGAMDALEARKRAGHDLFDATKQALAEWRESHAKVVRAVNERKPVSFASLMAASEEIKELSKRWREL